MVKKAGKDSKTPWDGATNAAFDVVLSQEEREALALEASQEVEDEQKALAQEEYKAQVKSALRKKMLFSDADSGKAGADKIAVFLDLPLTAPDVKLDGKRFIPLRTYHVKPAVAAVLFETMGRTFEHEADLQGPGKLTAYRKKQAYASAPSHVG